MTVAWKSVEATICRLLGCIHISLASAVLIGGTQRFPAPNYDSLLKFTHNTVWPYGSLWLVGGLLMLLPHTMLRIMGTAVVVMISSLWAALFAVAAYKSPQGALTPIAAYGGYALMNATMFWIMVMRRRNRRNNGRA